MQESNIKLTRSVFPVNVSHGLELLLT